MIVSLRKRLVVVTDAEVGLVGRGDINACTPAPRLFLSP
jgi:hypothetical protein